MEITRITEQNYDAFREILPFCQYPLPPFLFGCVAEGMAIGSAMLDVTKDGCSLSWFWIAEAYRRQGNGAAFLDTICQFAVKTLSLPLTLTYPADAKWAVILEYMLIQRGFSVMMHTYPQYRFTKEQLMDTPLLSKLQDKPSSNIIPFSALKHFQITELIEKSNQKKIYSVGHADFDHICKERSIALVSEGYVKGLTLIRPLEEKGNLCLDLVYLDAEYMAGAKALSAIAMLRQTALAVFRHPDGFRELRFTCIADVGVRLCRQLMGEQKAISVSFCHAVLQPDLYR